jgi:iron complex outermembrane recepter protein
MRKIITLLMLFATFVASSNTISGQLNTFSGQVVHHDETPVTNAKIRIVGYDIIKITDELGVFHFDAPKKVSYTIEVELDSYFTRKKNISFSSEKITLIEVNHSEIETIQVTASLRNKGVLEMAIPVNVLSGEELINKRSANLGETLAQEPGVSVSSYGSGAGRPVIRGLSGSRVSILQNGLSTLDASSTSPDHAVSSEPLLAEQIEILKGPVTLLYGGGAIGGVINVVDNRIPEKLPENGLEGAVEVRFNSGSEEKSGVARLDGGLGKWAWHMDGYKREAQDITLPSSLGEKLNNSDISADGATIGMSWLDENQSFIGVSFGQSNNNYGLPAEENADELVRLDVKQERFDIKGAMFKPFTGIKKIKLRYGRNNYNHIELEGGEIGTTFTNKADETRLELLHVPLDGWQGALGIQVNNRDFSAIGEEAFVPPSTTESIGVFLVEEKSFGNVNIELGIRSDTQTLNSDDLLNSLKDDAFSASIGSLWNFHPFYSFSIALARAQRIPNAEELLSYGPHLATQSFELGNTELKKESANNIDVSLRKNQGDIKFTLNAFYNSFDQFIYEKATGNIEDGLPVFQFTQEDATFKGLEFELDWVLSDSSSRTITLHSQADYVKGELSNGGYLPRMSPLRMGIGLLYEKNDWYIDLDIIRYMNQDNIAEFETSTGGYTLVDIDFNYQFSIKNSDYTFFMRGKNLLDDEVINHTSFIKDIAPQAGRSLTLGIRLAF